MAWQVDISYLSFSKLFSSVLAWGIPGTEEPGGLQSTGSHRVGHDCCDLAAAAAAAAANQNYNEISPHTSQNSHHQKVYKQ